MKKKIIPVIVALVLILVIGVAGIGRKLLDKYSYSRELADMDAYYGVSEGQLAILLQDDWISEKAVLIGGAVYFDLDTVHDYLNEGFYVDINEQKLLYTTANDTVQALFGSGEYTDKNGSHSMGYVICQVQGDVVYLAADYVKLFTNFAYYVYDRHLQLYTQWGEKQTMEIAKDTQVRQLGGIKSPVLREMEKGEVVELLEEMETWSKVKTSDSIIGYVENKRLTNRGTETEVPVTDYVAEEYTSIDRKSVV